MNDRQRRAMFARDRMASEAHAQERRARNRTIGFGIGAAAGGIGAIRFKKRLSRRLSFLAGGVSALGAYGANNKRKQFKRLREALQSLQVSTKGQFYRDKPSF